MADSLVDLLAEHSIRPKRYTAGHTEQIRCPKCDGGRTREISLTVTIDADGEGAVWTCHRGSCGWAFGARVGGSTRLPTRSAPPRPIVKPVEDTRQDRPEWLVEFFAQRGIGEETIDAFGAYATSHWFPDPIGDYQAIVFPYRLAGELVNRKYRPAPPHKQPQAQDKNALQTLFNVDSIESPDEVIWVEGEPDVMALHEAGYRQVVSLKDGAPNKAGANDEKRYAAMVTHEELLGKISKFILAGDMDEPGLLLREELARRLGRHRCWQVEWPPGCKDAGDTLKAGGKVRVQEAIAAARPYPIDGLQGIDGHMLLRLRHNPPPRTLTTGTRATDAILKLPGEGRLIVITGVPNHGKSSWFTYLAVHLMHHENRRFCIFSPEMQPCEQYAALCAEIYTGKPLWPRSGHDGMTDGEILHAGAWLGDRLWLLASDAEKSPPTLEWILERSRIAVLQRGTTDLALDPFNEIDQQRNGASETDYVGRTLQRLRSFAQRHGCNVWIVAHPTKLHPAKPGEKLPVPGLYDISGGANWANKADLGIAVYRAEEHTEIHLLKSRFGRWGRKGTKAIVEFDALSGRFHTPATPLGEHAP